MLYLHCRLSLEVNITSENWLHVGPLFVFFICFEANVIMSKLYRVKTFKFRKTVNDKSNLQTYYRHAVNRYFKAVQSQLFT